MYHIILLGLPSAQNNEYIHVLFRSSNAIFFFFSPSPLCLLTHWFSNISVPQNLLVKTGTAGPTPECLIQWGWGGSLRIYLSNEFLGDAEVANPDNIENPIFIQKGVGNGVVRMGKAPGKGHILGCRCLLVQSYARGPTWRTDCLGVITFDALFGPKSPVVADGSHWCPHWEPGSGVATLKGFQNQESSPSFQTCVGGCCLPSTMMYAYLHEAPSLV